MWALDLGTGLPVSFQTRGPLVAAAMHERGGTMKRNALQDLILWKSHSSRKPLLLRGARQTGKTWLIQEFGKTCFDDCLVIDFMRDAAARTLFEQDLDPRRILRDIELRYGRSIHPETTLLAFDEIQEAPRGITALKYFCEEAPEYPLIAAGSYMGIATRRKGESFPVGKVDECTLHPLSFCEFTRAVAGDPLADALEAADMPALAGVGDRLQQLLRSYYVVGGMPEAVAAFAETGDFLESRRIQQLIVTSYEDDFSKHAPGRILERMRMAWRSLPAQLAHENRRFVYGAVRPGARARDFEESLQWLRDYGVVSRVPRVNALRHPPNSYEDGSAFKLLCVDVGLLGALADLDPAIVLERSRLFTEFKGALTEQYVEQQLVALGLAPCYWSSPSGNAETDLAYSQRGAVIPIEVKAAENLKSKSLKAACQKFSLPRAVRTSLSPYRDEGWLVNIPLWAIGAVEKLA